MTSTPIPGITEEYFLSETEVHDFVSVIPDDTVTSDILFAWMSKRWHMGKRGRLLNVVKRVYRGHWSMATKCTVDYVRKSNTNEPDTTKKKLVNLQIYKMKTKLLCEDVFVSYNTSANDPIAEQDATTPPYTFDDCSGNTQNLITKSTKSARHICNVYKS
ncbi:hypothetical protein BDB01DRAFT_835893 [Pilobolus umbonatus]|nr:hypothetical protein BDB01DRAFT_835893 [Pilobolus umbonatus]